MRNNKFILMGLLAGAMVMGSACKSMSSSERNEPMEPAAAPAHPSQPPPPPNSTNPGTGGAGLQQDDGMRGTGGSGYDDAITAPTESSHSKLRSTPDIRDQDPVMDPGTGGSGYDKDGTLFRQDNSLSGDKFPGDHNVPQ